MSLVVFVQYFSDGKPGRIPMDGIRDIFAPYTVKKNSDGMWELFYGQSNCSYLCFSDIDEDKNVRGFRISRPCADERLWKCLYECLSLGNCVIICPGAKGMLTNNSDVRNHVPQDMIEGIGGLRIVRNYKEILKILNEKRF
jgi:hypothetical protein